MKTLFGDDWGRLAPPEGSSVHLNFSAKLQRTWEEEVGGGCSGHRPAKEPQHSSSRIPTDFVKNHFKTSFEINELQVTPYSIPSSCMSN